jgi:hypothetical protein
MCGAARLTEAGICPSGELPPADVRLVSGFPILLPNGPVLRVIALLTATATR